MLETFINQQAKLLRRLNVICNQNVLNKWKGKKNPFTSTYRRLTLSQRLTELAQRVDFSDFVKDNADDTGPAAKKPAQKWPWEFTHSKLKYVQLTFKV